LSGPLLLFAGGGTGGHLTPGIAVAQELLRSRPDCRIRFVGSDRPIEQTLLEPAGFDRTSHAALPLTALRRPLRFLRSHWTARRDLRRLMRRDRPAAVIGLGGFASVPVLLAAASERVPILLLEQNAIPGRATRWFARRSPVCLTFEGSARHLPRGAVSHVTGNPLRRELLEAAAAARSRAGRPEHPVLLVLGGSQGSRQVNESVISAVEQLASRFTSWRIVHQTGPHDVESTRQRYHAAGVNSIVEPFFTDPAPWYAASTLAISRAGATTLTELAAFGLPGILIPYPFAADNHQQFNAGIFVQPGAALSVSAKGRSADPVDLCPVLERLLDEPRRVDDMASAMRGLARLDAAAAVAAHVLRIASC